MNKYAIINLKTDPELKKRAAKTAELLGVSISAVLNNELRRFATEQSVSFEIPEAPNKSTAKIMADSKDDIAKGDYFQFEDTEQALLFLADELK